MMSARLVLTVEYERLDQTGLAKLNQPLDVRRLTMIEIEKLEHEKKPEPGSSDDLIPDIDASDPGKKVEEDGETPGGGNFA